MNFQIVTTLRAVSEGRKPLHLAPLKRCLAILEVPRRQSKKGGWYCFGSHNSPPDQMWDWLEQARNNHRRLIRVHHPDRGGSHERAAVLNSTWKRVQELMKRRGIELA